MGRLFLCLIMIAVSGCAAMQPTGPIKIGSVRPAPQDLQEVRFSIRKSDYSRALESSRGAANIRVVPMVVSAAQAPTSPEYRLFNIRKTNVGGVLGLENSDVLVAAHDFVVQSPTQFYAYLAALRGEAQSQIEIRRGDKPLLLKFTFIEG